MHKAACTYAINKYTRENHVNH